jgi:hypothetical protein
VDTGTGVEAPSDTDRDEMTDERQSEYGFDPALPDAYGENDAEWYANTEEFLSCLVGMGDGETARFSQTERLW